MLGWGIRRLDAVAVSLARRLGETGAVLVGHGDTLSIADDLTAIDRDLVDRTSRAVFARRRPNLPEPCVVHQFIHDRGIDREDLGTASGMIHTRLRTAGNADRPAGVKADAPRLSDDVRYSLMLDEPGVASDDT